MSEILRRPQIGVVGDFGADNLRGINFRIAKETGQYVAKAGATLMLNTDRKPFETEEFDSFSQTVSTGAKEAGGLVVGVTCGKSVDLPLGIETAAVRYADIVIGSGMECGGREFVLALSCDAIIAIGGRVGTLNTIAIACQTYVPVVAITGIGGWSEKLAREYFNKDKRRPLIEFAETPKEAVDKAMAKIMARRKAL